MTVTIRLRSILWFSTGIGIGVVCCWMLMSAWTAEAAPGDSDMTVVPITSCRLMDTRPGSQVGPRSAPLGTADTYTVDVGDATTPCAGVVPDDATGLVLNVTPDGATQPTFLTIWDSGAWPGTSSLNPQPGPPSPNAVTTKLADDGSFKVYNAFGTTHVIVDITGYLTPSSLVDLDAKFDALWSAHLELSARVSEIELKTAAISLHDGGETMRFSGVNVQVVDGSGETGGEVNGLGNLIVGYNEANGYRPRPGSHNLVVGENHSYLSHGGVTFGSTNTSNGPGASVTGGQGNNASGVNSSISGGRLHTATGTASSVSGGHGNTASGTNSSVSGGSSNLAQGLTSWVSGGHDNYASGQNGSVSGGQGNEASGFGSAVSGGWDNLASGENASVSGGQENEASSNESSVSGGVQNVASSNNSSVSGGYRCTADAAHEWSVGDRTNAIGCPTSN